MRPVYMCGIIILLFSGILQANPVSFGLSKKYVKKGEPFFAEVRVEGAHRIHPDKKVFSQDGVQAIYSGILTETKIINFKASMQTILRFAIIHSQEGRFRVPPISIQINGQEYTYPEDYFHVSAESFSSSTSNTIPTYGFPQQKENTHNHLVRFQTSKQSVYIGEPIIGFYIFYSGSPRIPVFERNPNESISLPFFSSELLTGVQISYPEEVHLTSTSMNQDSGIYYAKPYSREIFALTPLKAGNFQLGRTKFEIIDRTGFRYSETSLDVEPQSIQVRSLPGKEPKNFLGEVGVFEARIDFNGREVEVGNPWRGKVTILGEGLCNRLKDPIIDRLPNDFPGRIVSTGVDRSRRFIEKPDGTHGFDCEAVFYYAVYLEQSSKDFPIQISFFNPHTGTYEFREFRFPAIQLIEETDRIHEMESKDFSGSTIQVSYSRLVLYSIGSILIGLAIYWYRMKVYPSLKKKKDYFIFLEEISGDKNGIFLEKALSKVLPSEESQFLRKIRDKYPDYSFSKIYTILDYREREIFDNYINKGERKQ